MLQMLFTHTHDGENDLYSEPKPPDGTVILIGLEFFSDFEMCLSLVVLAL